MSKYRAKKATVDGITFDSQREMARYYGLKVMERAGLISNLRLQVPFELIPKTEKHRACIYRADFVYTTKDGREVVEDVKGFVTRDYAIKKKLLYWRHGVDIQEV